jgi:hypothetical protein
MKKVILLALVCLTVSLSAQVDTTKKEKKYIPYISAGLSVSSNSDFKAGSYAAVEAGVQRKNIALGAIFGRGNLKGLGRSTDNIKDYYYEVKATGYFPLGALTGSVILGWGGYINTVHTFIEYGVGISYSKGNFGYAITYNFN